MKIVLTVTDAGSMIHTGGPLEAKSAVIDIPEELIPAIVREYQMNVAKAREQEDRWCYQTLSFSILDERKESQP